MKVILLAACLALTPAVTLAQTPSPYAPFTLGQRQPTQQAPSTTSAYDWRTGSRYTTTRNPDGSSYTRGSNANTGSMWNSRTDSNGNSRGFDSNGNSWSYNPSSGLYVSSDGKTCIGKGALRTCN